MKTLLIGLTGPMGGGKSAAAEAFEQLGATVVDADALAHEVLEKDPETVAVVKRIAGENAYDASGKPDRAAVAKAAFSNPENLARLEAAVHPAVEKLWREAAAQAAKHGKVCVVEIPLLFEKKLEKNFDICVNVSCSEVLRKKRLALRGLSPEQISERDAFQLPPAEKAKRADIVLFNESDRQFLKNQAAMVLSRLTQ